MSLDLGDRGYGHGDQITFEASAAVEGGDFVAITGDGEVAPADTNANGPLVGVASGGAASGENVTVHLRGVVRAKVASGVAANDELGTPDASLEGSEAGVAEADGSTGIRALTGASNGEAEVLLR